MNIPRIYYECKILESDGMGRYKVRFLENGFEPNLFIQSIQTSEGESKEGTHSKYAVNDIVLLSFRDYPQSQQPFIFGKFSKESQRYDASDESTIMWKNHTITFKSSELEIKHKDGITITIDGSKIEFSKEGGALTKINYGTQDLIDAITKLIGNLGYTIVTPELTALIANQANPTNTITIE